MFGCLYASLFECMKKLEDGPGSVKPELQVIASHLTCVIGSKNADSLEKHEVVFTAESLSSLNISFSFALFLFFSHMLAYRSFLDTVHILCERFVITASL